MTVYDLDKGLVYGFLYASFQNNEWSSCGGTVYYLNSNGLEGTLSQSDEARNFGHRGVPPPTYAVRYDEIQAGVIDHVLKIAVNNTADENVFPMTGHQNGSTDSYAPPEGTRIRIKPSVDLSRMSLSPAARVVATALQKYGAVIGDQSGGPVALKVENTIVEGRGWLWNGVLNYQSLSSITLDKFDVIQRGYGSGSGSAPSPPPNAPSALTATAVSPTQIDLSWADNSADEGGFKIERSPNGTSDWGQIGTTGASVSSFSDTGLAADTTYHYRVRAHNAVGNSAYSNVASAKTHTLPPPDAAPTGLTATAVSASQINLAWTQTSSNEVGFRIERSPDGFIFAEIATVGANVTAYNDTGLAADATYHYRVRAYNAGGTSPYSNVASAKTHPVPLSGAVTLYLHNQATPPAGDTSAQKNMPMNVTAPTATRLHRYSTDLYAAYPGRLVEKTNTSSTQSSTKYMMNWTYQVSTNTAFNGNAELRLWVALKDHKCDKTPNFKAYLREKSSATTDTGIEFASASATSPPVGNEPCDFRLVTITLPVNRTITAGKWIELKVTVNESTGESALFAYDTTAHTSLLRLP
jgi:hypothetical protein